MVQAQMDQHQVLQPPKSVVGKENPTWSLGLQQLDPPFSLWEPLYCVHLRDQCLTCLFNPLINNLEEGINKSQNPTKYLITFEPQVPSQVSIALTSLHDATITNKQNDLLTLSSHTLSLLPKDKQNLIKKKFLIEEKLLRYYV